MATALTQAQAGATERRTSASTTSRPALLLVGVAVVFVALQLLIVRLTFGLGWDETVYASQVSSTSPPLFFSAPRARGVPALIAPVVHFTASTPVLRLYLALLGGVGLVLAYRPWLRVRPGYAVPVAAAAFGSLWIALYYGNEAMPNFWVALTAVAGAGYFVRARRESGARIPLAGVAVCFALMSLIRPTDSVYLAVPLLVAAVLRAPRWPRLLSIIAGLVVGWGAWAIEAQVRYGGFFNRLATARAEDANGGLHANVFLFFRTLGGPIECCSGFHGASWTRVTAAGAWWPAAVLLAAVGIYAARGLLRAGYALAVAMAATLAAQYFFVLGVVGVRHLLPTYALVALPVGEGLCFLVTAASRRWRPAIVAVIVLLAAAHVAVQLAFLQHNVHSGRTGRAAPAALATRLHRLGVVPPCVLIGPGIPPYAYAAGCAQLGFNEQLRSATASEIQALDHAGSHVAIVLRSYSPRATRLLPGWRVVRVHRKHLTRTLLLSPNTSPGTAG